MQQISLPCIAFSSSSSSTSSYLTAVIVIVVLICCLYSYRCVGNGRCRRGRLRCKVYLIVVISKLIASHRMLLHVLLGKVTNLPQREEGKYINYRNSSLIVPLIFTVSPIFPRHQPLLSPSLPMTSTWQSVRSCS